jgi:cellulose synthase operon protein C
VKRLRLLFLWCLVATALAACGPRSADDYLASAKASLAKDDVNAALVHLKNALGMAPDSGEARYLFGTLLLRKGSAEAAATELTRALEAKFDANLVTPALARAYLQTGQFKTVIDRFGSVQLSRPEGMADLQSTLASAWVMTGNTRRSQEAVEEALRSVPDYPPALLLRARLIASEGRNDDALKIVEALLQREQNNADAWELKGDLQFHGKRDLTAAAVSFRKAIELQPEAVRPHISLISMLLQQRDIDGARKQFELFKKAQPGHPQAAFYEALFTFLRGDHKRAREMLDAMLKVAPKSQQLLALSGANELRLGSLIQAESHLAKLIKLAPDHAEGRKLLAETFLNGGQPGKALDTVKPLLDRGDDPDALYLAAMAHLQSGSPQQAFAYLERAAAARPRDPRVNTAIALAKLARGESAAAFEMLSSISSGDKSDIADMALVGSHMQRKEYDAALKAIDVLERKQPTQPLPHDLRGRILLIKGDVPGARSSFEQALRLSPTYFPAAGRLAALDLSAGKPDEARKRVESVLAVDPRHTDALMALADLRVKGGGSLEAVSDAYQQAVKSNPTDRAPRMALIEYLLEKRAFKLALTEAQAAAATVVDDPIVLDALGRAQVANGDSQQALVTFGKVASLQPRSPMPLVRMAGLQTSRGDFDAAGINLRRALELAPDLLIAHKGLIELALRSGKVDAAVNIAKSIQKRRPAEAIGFVLEGDIHARNKNLAAARAAYESGMKAAPTAPGLLGLRLYAMLRVQGKSEEAARFAAQWTRDHPNDFEFLFRLGAEALQKRDLPGAERLFSEVVQKQGDHARALNNLAWVLTQLQKPGALPHVQRALILEPKVSAFHDTLALVLAASGDVTGAIDAEKRAIELEPLPAYRLALAKLYLKSNQVQAADSLLRELAGMGVEMPEKIEAKKLLAGR